MTKNTKHRDTVRAIKDCNINSAVKLAESKRGEKTRREIEAAKRSALVRCTKDA